MNKNNCSEHKFKHTPIILNQRYCNHKENRVETLIEVHDNKCVTDKQTVHIDYFKDMYTLRKS